MPVLRKGNFNNCFALILVSSWPNENSISFFNSDHTIFLAEERFYCMEISIMEPRLGFIC